MKLLEAAKSADLATTIRLLSGVDINVSRNHNTVCPLCGHGNDTPCFSLYTSKDSSYLGKFKCFSCGKTGDVVDFVQQYSKLDNIEACKKICEVNCIEYEENAPIISEQDKEDINILNDIAKIFAREYKKQDVKFFVDRKFSDTIIDSKQFGYCPVGFKYNDRVYNLGEYLKLKYPNIDYSRYGILNDKGDCLLSDRFVFPIRNQRGNVIGFSARSLNPSVAKYFNSKNCVCYNKSKALYGIEEAQRYSTVYWVEGIADAASLQSAGIMNVVASCGTAITNYQLKVLSGKQIILALDNDDAGKDHMVRLIKENKNVLFKVYLLDKYKDFNEALMAGEDLTSVLSSSKPMTGIEFVVKRFVEKNQNRLGDIAVQDQLYHTVASIIGGYAGNAFVEKYPLNTSYTPISICTIWKRVSRLTKKYKK